MAVLSQQIQDLSTQMGALAQIASQIQSLTADVGENELTKKPQDDLPGLQQSLDSELDFIQTLSRGVSRPTWISDEVHRDLTDRSRCNLRCARSVPISTSFKLSKIVTSLSPFPN